VMFVLLLRRITLTRTVSIKTVGISYRQTHAKVSKDVWDGTLYFFLVCVSLKLFWQVDVATQS
jgi:hypothetical protein